MINSRWCNCNAESEWRWSIDAAVPDEDDDDEVAADDADDERDDVGSTDTSGSGIGIVMLSVPARRGFLLIWLAEEAIEDDIEARLLFMERVADAGIDDDESGIVIPEAVAVVGISEGGTRAEVNDCLSPYRRLLYKAILCFGERGEEEDARIGAGCRGGKERGGRGYAVEPVGWC